MEIYWHQVERFLQPEIIPLNNPVYFRRRIAYRIPQERESVTSAAVAQKRAPTSTTTSSTLGGGRAQSKGFAGTASAPTAVQTIVNPEATEQKVRLYSQYINEVGLRNVFWGEVTLISPYFFLHFLFNILSQFFFFYMLILYFHYCT